MLTTPSFSADDITDPTDWASTSLPLLQRLDNSLRCQVCKEFLTAPLITECSHTFCSLCIRRYFTEQQKCPSCRVSGQEARLRRNAGVEECVEAFLALRAQLLGLLKESSEEDKLAEGVNGSGDGERDENSNSQRRGKQPRTVGREGLKRTKSRVISYAEPAMVDGAMDDISGEEAEMEQQQQYSPPPQPPPMVEPPAEPPAEEPNDGFAACPVCKNRMKADIIPRHIGPCLGEDGSGSNPTRSAPQPQQLPITSSFLSRSTRSNSSRPSNTVPLPMQPARTGSNSSLSATSTVSNPHQNPGRLPKLNYTLMKEKALREKLHELGIPNTGTKAQLQARHIEWVNLFNANGDSLRPKSKMELIRELKIWEKTINRDNGTTVGERRPTRLPGWSDEGWAKEHGKMYGDLIRQVKERAKRQKVGAGAAENEDGDGEGEGKGKAADKEKVEDDDGAGSLGGDAKETTDMNLSTSQEQEAITRIDTSNNSISAIPLPQQSQLPHFSPLQTRPISQLGLQPSNYSHQYQIEHVLHQPQQVRLEDDPCAFPSSSQDNRRGALYNNPITQPLYPYFHSALQTQPPPPPQATLFAPSQQSSSSFSSYAQPVASTQVQPQMHINTTIHSPIPPPTVPVPTVRTRGMAKRTRSEMEESRGGVSAGDGNGSGNRRSSRSSSSGSSSQVYAAAAAVTGVE